MREIWSIYEIFYHQLYKKGERGVDKEIIESTTTGGKKDEKIARCQFWFTKLSTRSQVRFMRWLVRWWNDGRWDDKLCEMVDSRW